MKFVIEKSKDGQFYFVLKARNGQVLVTSETYKRKASCKKAIWSMKDKVFTAKIIDKTE